MAVETLSDLPVCIAGIGSAQGADSIGWLAIHRLDSGGLLRRYPPGMLELEACDSPGLLAACCYRARALIVLDAYVADDAPGRVRRFEIGELDSLERPTSCHGIDLAQALEMIAVLEGRARPVAVFGICTGQRPHGLSAQAVHGILDQAYTRLVRLLDGELQGLIAVGDSSRSQQS